MEAYLSLTWEKTGKKSQHQTIFFLTLFIILFCIVNYVHLFAFSPQSSGKCYFVGKSCSTANEPKPSSSALLCLGSSRIKYKALSLCVRACERARYVPVSLAGLVLPLLDPSSPNLSSTQVVSSRCSMPWSSLPCPSHCSFVFSLYVWKRMVRSTSPRLLPSIVSFRNLLWWSGEHELFPGQTMATRPLFCSILVAVIAAATYHMRTCV